MLFDLPDDARAIIWSHVRKMRGVLLKVRAEVTADIVEFIIHNNNHINSPTIMYATEMKFWWKGTLETCRLALAQIEDGHVMLQTVSHAKDYTGYRLDFDHIDMLPYNDVEKLPRIRDYDSE